MASQQKRAVLVTGCSKGGAGHALALEFARQGMRVFATARSTKTLVDLESHGIETLALDVTSAESIAELKDEITKRTGGKLHVLFNNAGLMMVTPAIEADPVATRRMFDTNLFGVMDMVTAFSPLLISAAGDTNTPPTIINTASILSKAPYPFSSAYNASKAAVVSYSDTLRLELKPLGVKVVTLFMGQVSTNITGGSAVIFSPQSVYSSVEEAVRKRADEHIGTSMKPEEFAKLVVTDLLVKKPALEKGETIWKGTNALLIWALRTFGPYKVFDSTMEKDAGLTPVTRKAIFEKSQSGVGAKGSVQ